MIEVLDTKPFYDKLSKGQPLTEDEIVSVLKMAEHFKMATAYLADCHAATLEGFSKSASKSSRFRQASICTAAAALLIGDSSPVRFPMKDLNIARTRCVEAVAEKS